MTVFITGATGNMGFAVLSRLLEKTKLSIRVLAYPDHMGRKKLFGYRNHPRLTIFWGDLTDYADVRAALHGSDIVLHLGALIPPTSQHHPELAMRVNYGGTQHVIRAIQQQKHPERIRLVFIGTIAESGNREPPAHWSRIGDPIHAGYFDSYGQSKILAERAVIESGLSGWVSLRQTAMLHPRLFGRLDPILFHQPLDTHMEWVTVDDTARALSNLCIREHNGTLPESFWQNIYHIGGGEGFRVTTLEFLEKGFRLMGIKDFRKVINPNWFATGNFHGSWFLDSERLNEILAFRKDTLDGYFASLRKNLSFRNKLRRVLAGITPGFLLKFLVMKPIAARKHGTLHALKAEAGNWIQAFWGSESRWEQLPRSWRNLPIRQFVEKKALVHGYDETKSLLQLDISDMQRMAGFRGGICLSEKMTSGDLSSPLEWKCECGNVFTASPRLIALGGHWCPKCDVDPDRYAAGTGKNLFLNQILAPHQELIFPA